MKLLLSLRINLYDFNSDHRGAIFHRWLPDGQKDSIYLDVIDPNIKFRVWFERCGYTDDVFIRFDEKQREIDPQIISMQGCLYSGPLFGLLEIENLPIETLQAIKESRLGDENYKNFAKKIAKDVIYKPISEFIETIRIKFGQFWIREFTKWDSRSYSLGYYCSSVLGMRWSLDDGKSWKILDPDEPEVFKIKFYAKSGPDYLQFMTKDDWESISEFEFMKKSSNIFLIRSHQLSEEENLRLAFIEGVAALELSIHDFIRNRVSKELLITSAEAFYNLPLHTQLTVLCTSFGALSQEQIEQSVKAVKIRNQIVHDGLEPKDETKQFLYSLLNTVSYLSGGGVSKFPSNMFTKTSVPEDGWPKFYKKSKPSN